MGSDKKPKKTRSTARLASSRKAKITRKGAAGSKAATAKAPSRRKKSGPSGARAKGPAPGKRPAGFPIVGIGASAGGLEASEAFFGAVPPDSGMAFVLVVHLDPTHVSVLPELLQRNTRITVQQIRSGMRVQPNALYVIPPNRQLEIIDGVLRLRELPIPAARTCP